MAKKTSAIVKHAGSDLIPFDPASLSDPLALQTGWNPMKPGGMAFRTHRLVTVGSHRMALKASLFAISFYSSFILLALGLASYFGSSLFTAGLPSATVSGIRFVFFWLIALIAAIPWAAYRTSPIVFDKKVGGFWKGRFRPKELSSQNSKKLLGTIDQIHALQIVAEYCEGKVSFHSFELNLIFKNGHRANLMDHADIKKVREHAASLSAFLNVPVWDSLHGRVATEDTPVPHALPRAKDDENTTVDTVDR